MGKVKDKRIENQQKEIASYCFHDEREKTVLTNGHFPRWKAFMTF